MARIERAILLLIVVRIRGGLLATVRLLVVGKCLFAGEGKNR